MRKVICIEGVPFPGMRTLAMKGSIYLAENIEKIPITQAYNHEKILGYARNLQRNIETGEVSMDLVIHPSFDVNLDEFTATVTLTDVMGAMGKDEPDLNIINAGCLREVALIWEGPKDDAPVREA